MTDKVCNKCNELLPFSAFAKRKDSKDGHRATCKACVAATKAGNKPAAKPTTSPITEETDMPANKVATLNQMAKGKESTFIINPDDLIVNWDDNIRKLDESHAEGFADSYEAGDFIPPALVKKTKEGWKLVAGYHRTKGYYIATERGVELPGMLVMEFKGGSDAEIATMIMENDGKPLTGLERAHAYAKLRGQKWEINQIAAAVKRSRADVEKYLILADATQQVKDLIEEGVISVQVAVEAVRKYGDQAYVELMKKLKRAAGKEGKKGSVNVDPKFSAKLSRDFMFLGNLIKIDDDYTTDEQVTIFAELTPEQWAMYGDIIEKFKAFCEENEL